MNWKQQGTWIAVCERIKRTWGKLSEDDLVAIAGQRSQLTACLQDRYGLEKQDAEDRVERFVQELQH